ncbi:MerR family DNA-binding transcriptional regulator [Paracoccaceae bacterium]|jgi:DNA-binding transcriptional MerR regulator|nr:MerR family DNA-binding transcriptional regulator [Paracoccaceae bacterium]MDG1677210.1 MerR family DNA-binding transcriptional regulator [Paracoccaceae bacterium]|tara:strand:- start:199 stop:576 length:378 start_codon:yes stop_codon:yes gene_type:complete
MSDVRLTFKEMCSKFEVTPRTLRYYEYIELLSPERQGRSRFYGARECARMTLILRGRNFGFQLEELRQWLLIYDQDGTEAQMEVFLKMAERKLKELKEQQIQLAETLEELENLRKITSKTLHPKK